MKINYASALGIWVMGGAIFGKLFIIDIGPRYFSYVYLILWSIIAFFLFLQYSDQKPD